MSEKMGFGMGSEENPVSPATERDLPAGVTLKDITKHDPVIDHRRDVTQRRLLDDDNDISKSVTNHRIEENRRKMAAESGLPEDATLDDITKHRLEENRRKVAAERGLPEDATWEDIIKAAL